MANGRGISWFQGWCAVIYALCVWPVYGQGPSGRAVDYAEDLSARNAYTRKYIVTHQVPERGPDGKLTGRETTREGTIYVKGDDLNYDAQDYRRNPQGPPIWEVPDPQWYQRGSEYVSDRGQLKVRISRYLTEPDAVRGEALGQRVDFGAMALAFYDERMDRLELAYPAQDAPQPPLVNAEGNILVFSEVFPGVDVQYVREDHLHLRQEVVLRDRARFLAGLRLPGGMDPSQMKLLMVNRFDLRGARVQEIDSSQPQYDGRGRRIRRLGGPRRLGGRAALEWRGERAEWVVLDDQDRSVIQMRKGYAWDESARDRGKGGASPPAAYRRLGRAWGEYTLSEGVSWAWLTADQRHWPVTIDYELVADPLDCLDIMYPVSQVAREVWTAGNTYYLPHSFTLKHYLSHLDIEGGAVVKLNPVDFSIQNGYSFWRYDQPVMFYDSGLTVKGSPYNYAIITSADDNSVGEPIPAGDSEVYASNYGFGPPRIDGWFYLSFEIHPDAAQVEFAYTKFTRGYTGIIVGTAGPPGEILWENETTPLEAPLEIKGKRVERWRCTLIHDCIFENMRQGIECQHVNSETVIYNNLFIIPQTISPPPPQSYRWLHPILPDSPGCYCARTEEWFDGAPAFIKGIQVTQAPAWHKAAFDIEPPCIATNSCTDEWETVRATPIGDPLILRADLATPKPLPTGTPPSLIYPETSYIFITHNTFVGAQGVGAPLATATAYPQVGINLTQYNTQGTAQFTKFGGKYWLVERYNNQNIAITFGDGFPIQGVIRNNVFVDLTDGGISVLMGNTDWCWLNYLRAMSTAPNPDPTNPVLKFPEPLPVQESPPEVELDHNTFVRTTPLKWSNWQLWMGLNAHYTQVWCEECKAQAAEHTTTPFNCATICHYATLTPTPFPPFPTRTWNMPASLSIGIVTTTEGGGMSS